MENGTGLVWKGRILRELKGDCPHGDFVCEFACGEVKPFRLRVCGQLLTSREAGLVEVPMLFRDSGEPDSRVFNTATDITPLSYPWTIWDEFRERFVVWSPRKAR